MWPWGHLAVGYLLYSPLASVRFRRPPTGRATTLLAVGTQLPDLIDKPLAWGLDVLPAGRSLGHSVVIALLISSLVYAYADRRDCPDVGLAFGVGYLSHPFVDALFPLLNGQYQYVAYLLWPLFGVWDLPPFDIGRLSGRVLIEPLELLLSGYEPVDFDITVSGLIETTVVLLAGRTWVRDGAPIVTPLRDRLESIGESNHDPDQ